MEAAQTALELLGNASMHINRERRKAALQSMNLKLADMAEDDTIYKSAGLPSLESASTRPCPLPPDQSPPRLLSKRPILQKSDAPRGTGQDYTGGPNEPCPPKLSHNTWGNSCSIQCYQMYFLPPAKNPALHINVI